MLVITQEHLCDGNVYFRWLWMTNRSLLSHFNHMVLCDIIFLIRQENNANSDYFPFQTCFSPTKENLELYVIDWIIGPNSSPVCDFLTWGLAICFALDSGILVMWCKQRVKMCLQSQACPYAFQRAAINVHTVHNTVPSTWKPEWTHMEQT